jgi:tetratricopeptide (TPR) repeat protein
MFNARRKPSYRQATLERRYDFHLAEAIRASLAGSYDKAETHSGTALSISRELYAKTGAYRQGLAAALASHAVSAAAYGRTEQAVALLVESAGHYAALADADPGTYEVPRIDVLTRVAVAADATGNTKDAIALLREVIGMYGSVPDTAQPWPERDMGLALARFHLGRCLLKDGAPDEALAQLDAGLADADRAWEQLGPDCAHADGAHPDCAHADGAHADRAHPEPGHPDGAWLGRAPRFVQLAAPEWAASAVRAMQLHAAAGRWDGAARASRAAVWLSAGLAAIGGDAQRETHAAILARASVIWAQEQGQRAAAGLQEG